MAASHFKFELPRIQPLTRAWEVNHEEWNWAVWYHIDWFQLRGFVEGTAVEPGFGATREEILAHRRKKMMAYCIVRGSLGSFIEVLKEANYTQCIYDNTYEVRGLWEVIHSLIPRLDNRWV
ncbi:hypothetical protein C8A00DRAFT_34847 [Chaetomidium leptoderma]|uniref:Uncharacterized protein n=1 Tax=Chaetomidium leptoderma TaxID=669021 RepID=A0AAN6VJM9_9PEZI|nr:hypothetical protein C8A00DRAFT_34847 [Chaetomidium leptoderma]